jgi:AcrR family transcriptional regulator
MSGDPTTAPPAARQVRADARDNHQRLLAAAFAVFQEQGQSASLNEVARRAGVGPGTLYRHFPNLQALLAVLIARDIDALCANGRELLSDPLPADALQSWLRSVTVYATAMKGLVATQLAAHGDGPPGTPIAVLHQRLLGTGAALVERAQVHGGFSQSTDIRDLLRLSNAIAWISVQAPGDPGLIDRMMTMLIESSLARKVVFATTPSTVLPTRAESKGLWARRRHGRDTEGDAQT